MLRVAGEQGAQVLRFHLREPLGNRGDQQPQVPGVGAPGVRAASGLGQIGQERLHRARGDRARSCALLNLR